MFDTKFKQALFDCMSKEYDLLLSDEDDYKYEFSKKFERKMKKLISRRNKSYYHIINTSHKRAACIILAIIIATITAVAGVGAIRDKIKKYHISRLKEYSIIRSENIDDADHGKIIEDTCNITYGLTGYKITQIAEDLTFRNITYSKGNNIVMFYQTLSGQYIGSDNTEGVEVKKIYTNGNETLYFKDIMGYYTYIWDDGKYAFKLMMNGTKEESLKMAESVKITGDYKLEEIKPKTNYEITYDLKKYKLINYWISYYEPYEKYDIDDYSVLYTKDEYSSNIMFLETKKELFIRDNLNQKYDDNNARIFHTKINGKEAIFFLNDNYDYDFVWSNDEYVFELTVPFSFTKEEGIKLAESVKKSRS